MSGLGFTPSRWSRDGIAVSRHHVNGVRLCILATSLLIACPAAAPAREHGSPRDISSISAIIVHAVGGPACVKDHITFKPIPFRADDTAIWQQALKRAPVADAHFVIGRSGTVETIVPIEEVANHTVGANTVSIGIELVNRGDGREPFAPAQIDALIGLIKTLRKKLPQIRFNNVVGHNDLDQRTCLCGGEPYRRRQDPGANFPWAKVLAGVRLPTDPARGAPTLTPLTGPAPSAACPVF